MPPMYEPQSEEAPRARIGIHRRRTTTTMTAAQSSAHTLIDRATATTFDGCATTVPQKVPSQPAAQPSHVSAATHNPPCAHILEHNPEQ